MRVVLSNDRNQKTYFGGVCQVKKVCIYLGDHVWRPMYRIDFYDDEDLSRSEYCGFLSNVIELIEPDGLDREENFNDND